jgi:signal transduction histidine kinase
VLQVSDTGPGLDAASAASAFTRGWSTKPNGKPNGRLIGRGLGLALVGQAAHRHHGTVEVGRADAGFVDAGFVDAGFVDAGSVEAGSVKAGSVKTVGPVKTVFAGAVFTVRLPLAVEVAP